MPFEFSKNEEKILSFWQKNRIFEKSVANRKKAENFVFFEGPPTANGRPGIHHLEARAFKDIICRYKTMRGYRVVRKGGWDTHGLPVEIEVEKKLGIKHKSEIEKYGIAKFNALCKESVWQYKQNWEDFTRRIGYWVDLDNAYITYQTNYIESVWNILAKTFNKGLLYKDYRVAPYCPRCGTTLSSHEVSQGYKTAKDNSIYVKFPLQMPGWENTSLLVWTTTPWTLPANVAVAVNAKLKYVKAKVGEEILIVAKSQQEILGKEANILEEFSGEKLLGASYIAPFPVDLKKYEKNDLYKIIVADFVSDTDGTGFVHLAPAFGEDDMNAVKDAREKKQFNFPILKPVNEQGEMEMPEFPWHKKFVKTADSLIIADLKAHGLLFQESLYEHEYPFCWRCKSPLLYYAMPSWFIKMRALKEQLIANNGQVDWTPEHLKEGRFGEWLNDIKDWNLSRSRFWGTPLPIWECSNKNCLHTEAIRSITDLASKKYTDNRFFVIRHGFSVALQKSVNSSWPEKFHCPLTKEGEQEVHESAKALEGQNIQAIYASDLLRTKQTAEIVAQHLNLPVIYDERLREMNVGIFNGEPTKKSKDWYKKQLDIANVRIPEGESASDVRKRSLDFLNDINKKHKGQNILIVSHEINLTLLEKSMQGLDVKDILTWRLDNKESRIKTAEVREIHFAQIPFDENGEINLHRPYIDDVSYKCAKCGQKMIRQQEVIDCWFDSGSMPFAQYHYPFENKDLIDHGTNGNTLYIMRHGHSERQTTKISSCWPEKKPLHLTTEGVKEVIHSAKRLANKNIDLIVASDLLRTKQTAQIVGQFTGAKVIFDKRLREYNTGIFNGEDPAKSWDWLHSQGDREKTADMRLPKGESFLDVQKRMLSLTQELIKKYKNKNIVLVSHELPISILEGYLAGIRLPVLLEKRYEGIFKTIPTAGFREMELALAVDKKLKNENSQFPADYISEAVDQTRGWFYTLLAISTLLNKGPAYKKVISLGHVLDEKGEKMSKSKGNIVDPWDIVSKYGADASRWYLYTINGPGEPKLFSEKDVDGAVKRFLMTYLNCVVFLETYGKKSKISKTTKIKPKTILDKWIISRLNGLIAEMSEKLDAYDIMASARALEKFVSDDLSLWYIRRSRKRFQNPQNAKDLAQGSLMLSYIFDRVSKLGAPFIPFFSEEIFARISGSQKQSVHLQDWPNYDKKLVDKKLEAKMAKAREIIANALSLRAKAGLKVRQPLLSLSIIDKDIIKDKELSALIKEELNVKKVILGKELQLDTNITPELKEEGNLRDIMRSIQDMRKEVGLQPKDRITVCFTGQGELIKTLKKYQKQLLKEAKIAKVEFVSSFDKYPFKKEIKIEDQIIFTGIKKIK